MIGNVRRAPWRFRGRHFDDSTALAQGHLQLLRILKFTNRRFCTSITFCLSFSSYYPMVEKLNISVIFKAIIIIFSVNLLKKQPGERR